MAKEVAQSRKLEVVKLYFEGLPYDGIAQKTGVAKGSVAVIVEALKDGKFPQSEQLTEIWMNFGDRIKSRRQNLKMTQQELARALGLTAQHISAIEQNKRMPSLNMLANLAEQLGVSTDYLVSGKEGVVTGVVPAIKADKSLNLKVKRALIALIEELWSNYGVIVNKQLELK